MLKSLVFTAAMGLASSALAQPATPPNEKPPQSRPLHITGSGYASEEKDFWFRISVAPQIVSHRPFADDIPTTDSTEVSWTLGTDFDLGRAFTLELEGGPVAILDTDEDAEDGSALAFAATVIAGDGPIKGFSAYGLEVGYSDFFDARSGTSHSFEIGGSAEYERQALRLGLAAAARLVRSTEELEDHHALRVKPEFVLEIIPEAVSLHIDAEGQRRWYSDVNPAINVKRRDWSLQAFVGLDLTEGFNRALRLPENQHVFDDVLIGAVWVENDSNVDDEDVSELRIKPAISLKVYF